jgi:predicted TIM-barrel fold metal-dependent hydrolase
VACLGVDPNDGAPIIVNAGVPGPRVPTPKYYPRAIIASANTRGADKVMYAGYYPMGLSLRRIFEELPGVPLRDEAWPKFLRDNAIRVFQLEDVA